MAERPRRPAPRTLAAAPPPSSRVPHSTLYQARFPSLVTVIAGGAFLPACNEPQCGSTRADELQTHGPQSMSAARRGDAPNALREIGVALGLVAHTNTPRIQAPGEVMPVTVLPRPPEPQVITSGAEAVVSPVPIQPQGGPRAVNPMPPQPVPHTHPQTVPQPHPAVPGGMRMVAPDPPPPPPRAPAPRAIVVPSEVDGGIRAVTPSLQ